jgi:hypothetical protein
VVKDTIQEFVDSKIQAIMAGYAPDMKDYVIDLYLEKTKTWIIDINPWIPECVEGLLFSWESLENPEMLDLSNGP